MFALNVAFLWHQHQPYYKMKEGFAMPWVRFHAVKDYFDLPEILHEFPQIKQTFNLVPSLLTQLNEYLNGVKDNIQILSEIKASELSIENKEDILDTFFMCNIEKMVLPYTRYRELYEMSRNTYEAMLYYTEQDWLDLQVWYNLTWVGEYSRQQTAIRRLFNKGANFTEEEKMMLLDFHQQIIRKVIPQMSLLKKLQQVEVSFSPFYHPILPLLIDNNSAKEALPRVNMPNPIFQYPDDANQQIIDSCNYYENTFYEKLTGMWPSEGSVSNEALELIAKNGIKWIATDEAILKNTQKENYIPTEKFFPRQYKKGDTEISIFFRDHFLSDRIGFVYSNWNENDAANDFCHHLHQIRNEIISVHGEQALEFACVAVILDGENCWEYYPNNGLNFLRTLYHQISNDSLLKTVTMSEAIDKQQQKYLPELNNIYAGSWINADFNIWIGHKEDQIAWSILSKLKKEFDNKSASLTVEKRNLVEQYIHIAEGSDWYWWYGDDHRSDQDELFDFLFRYYIAEAYKEMGISIPDEVYAPIKNRVDKSSFVLPKAPISPLVDGCIKVQEHWENAGYFNAKSSMTAMHQVGAILDSFYFGADDKNIYFRLDTLQALHPNENIILNFTTPIYFKLNISKYKFSIEENGDLYISRLQFAINDVIEIALPKDIFVELGKEHIEITMNIDTNSQSSQLHYPRQGELKLIL